MLSMHAYLYFRERLEEASLGAAASHHIKIRSLQVCLSFLLISSHLAQIFLTLLASDFCQVVGI